MICTKDRGKEGHSYSEGTLVFGPRTHFNIASVTYIMGMKKNTVVSLVDFTSHMRPSVLR